MIGGGSYRARPPKSSAVRRFQRALKAVPRPLKRGRTAANTSSSLQRANRTASLASGSVHWPLRDPRWDGYRGPLFAHAPYPPVASAVDYPLRRALQGVIRCGGGGGSSTGPNVPATFQNGQRAVLGGAWCGRGRRRVVARDRSFGGSERRLFHLGLGLNWT